MIFFTTAFTLSLAAQAIAQTTTPTREQWEAITSDLAPLATSILNSPILNSDFQAALPYIPKSALNEADIVLEANAWTSNAIPYSFLTATPSVPWGPWSTYLSPSQRSELEAFVTSVGVAEQSIISKDLSFTGGTGTTTTASGSMITSASSSGGTAGAANNVTSTESGVRGPAASSSTAGSGAMALQVEWAMGAGVGAFGVVAALL